MLRAADIDVSGVLVDPHRPTARKTRILARSSQEVQQQIVRVDRVDPGELEVSTRASMIAATCSRLADCDAFLISDYENGVIAGDVLDTCMPLAHALNLTVVVDAHRDLFRFRGVTAATPNQPEAAMTVGRPIETLDHLDAAGNELMTRMEAQAILITRGSDGMVLYHHGSEPLRLEPAPGDGNQVVDPNGAGDTVAAVFTLALAAGASPASAALLANAAAAVVVRRMGPATLTQTELRAAIARHE